MTKVGSRELKNRLGRYLHAVRNGQTLVITDRGNPVAKIVPMQDGPAQGDAIQKILQQLAAEGLVRLAERPLSPFSPVKGKGKSGSHMIIEDRV